MNAGQFFGLQGSLVAGWSVVAFPGYFVFGLKGALLGFLSLGGVALAGLIHIALAGRD